MTTPPDPNEGARMRANAFLRAAESRISRRWFGALTRWLDRVRPQVVTRDGIVPGNVGQNAAFWGQLMDSEVVPESASLYRRVRNRIIQRDEPVTDPDAAAFLNEVGNRLRRIPDEVYALIVKEIETGLALGESNQAMAQRVNLVLTATGSERWPNRAITVARTESLAGVNAGAYAGAIRDAEERGDLAPFKVWISTEDARTRPTHVEADGQRTLLTEPFRVGGAQIRFPGDPRGPAQEVINCHPGDVRVAVTSPVLRVYRRWYEGPMVWIKTLDGVELSATPNHPLLTDAGWQSAESLKVGDHLVGTISGPRVGAGQPDVQNAVPTFEELYRAAVQSGVGCRIVGSAVDFHGDGSAQEIQVVFPHGVLRGGGDSPGCKCIHDRQLIRLHDGQPPFPLLCRSDRSDGTGDRPELRASVLTKGSVSSGGPRFPLLGGGVPHADGVRFTSAPNREAQFTQAEGDDASADPEVVRKALDGLPGGVTSREIVEIDVMTFHGYVYNLETVGGWYIANDTASHNCRCTFLPVTLGETLDWTDRQDP